MREGWHVNHKRTYRLYKELGLQLRNKTPKRRVKAKLRQDRQPATRPNEVWAMDFLHDQLATGRKIRVLTVVDTFSRFSPVLDARFCYRGEDVVRTLEEVCVAIGYPKTIRVDQGTEFVSRDLDLWAYAKGVTLDFSRPGKPTDNAFAEAFNSRVRLDRERRSRSKRALVPDACRCAAKVGGLAHLLQRGSAARGHRA
jgi:putative transposase